MMRSHFRLLLFTFPVTGFLLLALSSCSSSEPVEVKSLEVTATAYNSVEAQTKPGDPATAAWGDKLEPGVKAIAVSRDLLKQGLDYNTPVKIEGLPGTYRVLDKMHRRWNNRIDIYMGEDIDLAKEWGRQTVEISWAVEEDPEADQAN
jgi:3D (Asp-Asp-Asp) domain-containing protein